MLLHQASNSFNHRNYNAFIYEKCNWTFHFHKSYELVYMIEGEMDMRLDNRLEHLKQGDFALILPNQIHSHSTPVSSKVWIGVFSEDFVHEFARETGGKEGTVSVFDCPTSTTDFLLKELIKASTPEKYILKACLYAACHSYLKAVPLILKQTNRDNLVYRVLEYVGEHFTENLTLKGMAQDLGYEYHYISRCFHNTFDVNFRQFVNHYRFDHAKNLLIEGRSDITSVALESGFQSIRSFNRVFRELSGQEPRRYGMM